MNKKKIDFINKKINKKSQMQILEQVIVIVIFSFILLLALVFYLIYQKEDIQSKARYLEEQESIKLAEILVHMPELSSPTFIEKSGSFLDLEKIKIFSNISQQSIGKDLEFMKVYSNMLKYSNITINIIYPFNPSMNQTYNIYDFPPPNGSYTGSSPIFYPYIVYDPYNKIQYFSIIEIRKYTTSTE